MSVQSTGPRPLPLPRPLQTLVDDTRARWRATAAPEPGSAAAVLGEAICRDRLRVAYQPIVELENERLIAVEALVRLPDPPHPELVGPAEVVAVAEASGLVRALGTEVLFHACSQLAAWRELPHLVDLQVHVNVSPLQLRDDRFVEILERALEVTRLPACALVVEVTESAAFEGDGVAEAVLATLSSLGVAIAIDDFGTGFASLELLASTPARSIKLDRSFVASVGELGAPPRGRALVVQAAIGLGQTLGLRVVAEGIETVAQARTLRAWGCVYGQGYLYAKPGVLPPYVLTPPTRDATARPAVWDRSPQLSAEATDLALAIATVVATANPNGGTGRADVQQLALQLAEVLDLDRRDADAAVLLATIADAPQRFAEVVNPRSEVSASVELARVLGARSHLGRPAAPGSVAATARQLAMARRDGSTIDQALEAFAGDADPAVVERITAWWHARESSPSPLQEMRAVERRLRNRDDATRRLRALSALTQAIGGAGTLEDVLEVTAEEARSALGASSLTICRVDRERGELRALVNVGDLPAWQQRRPEDESYPLTDYPLTIERLIDRAVHLVVSTSNSNEHATNEARVLAAQGRGSGAAVPILVAGVTWGAVVTTTAEGEPPFTAADTPFLTAIASVVGLAIQRSAHVDHLARLADEDPLTRIANRRALEHRLERALTSEDHPLAADGTAATDSPEVGLLLLDIDGLNAINSIHGHAQGDRALVRVADVITRIALTRPGAFPARLGGDEFCIVLEDGGHDVEDVEDLLGRIRARLLDGPSPRPTLSAGYASVRSGTVTATELLRRADAAQYLARRTGVPLSVLGADSEMPCSTDTLDDTDLSTLEPSNGRATDAALRRWAHTLDDRSRHIRLEGLGEAVGTLLDLNRWVISEHCRETDAVHTRSVHVRRRLPNREEWPETDEEEFFDLRDYPVTAAALRDGVGFSVHVDDAAADRAERELLTEYGQSYLIAIPANDSQGKWLLELYADGLSTLLPEARPVVEALASRTLMREITCPPGRPRPASAGLHDRV